MLSQAAAEELLQSYGRTEPWTRHCRAVARVAAALAREVARERSADVDFTRSAGLLHDIGRCRTHDPVLHGVEGYRLLAARGHADEAFVCASHVLFGLSEEDAAAVGLPHRPFVPTTCEHKLVALADLLVDFDRPTTLTARFAGLRERYASHAFFATRLAAAEVAARSFARTLEREIDRSAAGVAAEALGEPGTV